jgi:hypothetical protein
LRLIVLYRKMLSARCVAGDRALSVMPPLPHTSKEQYRERFAAFLNRLAAGVSTNTDWRVHVVAHYLDEELEAIRCDLVKLMIKRDPGGHPIWVDEDRLQFEQWSQVLRKTALA